MLLGCSVTSKADKWERKAGQGVGKSLTTDEQVSVRNRKVPGFILGKGLRLGGSAGVLRGMRRVFLRKAGMTFLRLLGKSGALFETEDDDSLRDGDFLRGGVTSEPEGDAVGQVERDASHVDEGSWVLDRTK